MTREDSYTYTSVAFIYSFPGVFLTFHINSYSTVFCKLLIEKYAPYFTPIFSALFSLPVISAQLYTFAALLSKHLN